MMDLIPTTTNMYAAAARGGVDMGKIGAILPMTVRRGMELANGPWMSLQRPQDHLPQLPRLW